MSRRKLFLVGVTTLIASALFLYLLLRPRATVENYRQIHDGMNLADVEAILGPPAYRSKAPIYGILCTNAGTLREEYAAFEETDEEVHWIDGGGTILVGFRGTVTCKRYDARQDESPVDKFRRWIWTARKALGW